jgi:hypothetical protein
MERSTLLEENCDGLAFDTFQKSIEDFHIEPREKYSLVPALSRLCMTNHPFKNRNTSV